MKNIFLFYSRTDSKDPSHYFLSIDDLLREASQKDHTIANVWTGSFEAPLEYEWTIPF